MFFDNYAVDNFYDEMFFPDGSVRPHYAAILERLRELSPEEFEGKRQAVDLSFLS